MDEGMTWFDGYDKGFDAGKAVSAEYVALKAGEEVKKFAEWLSAQGYLNLSVNNATVLEGSEEMSVSLVESIPSDCVLEEYQEYLKGLI